MRHRPRYDQMPRDQGNCGIQENGGWMHRSAKLFGTITVIQICLQPVEILLKGEFMNRALIFLLFIFHSHSVTHGQVVPNSTNHYVGYSLGMIQAKDANLLPKVHSGAIHCLTYSLEMKNDSYELFEFGLGYGPLKTEIANDAGSWNAQLQGGYTYSFKMHQDNSLTYYLGPKLAYTSSLSEYQTWDEAHAYWGSCISLAVSNVLFVDLHSDRSFVVHLDLSLLGLAARPKQHRLYSNEYWTFSNIVKIMNRDYQFGAWNNALQLRASAEYRTPIFGSKTISLSCSLYYSRLRADEENPLTEVISKFDIGIWL